MSLHIEKKKIVLVASLLFLVQCVSCVQLLDPANDPNIDWEMIERSTLALNNDTKTSIEGVYAVQSGGDQFGDTVALRFTGARLCIYANTDVIFAEMTGGIRNDSFYFAGYFTTVRSAKSSPIEISADTSAVVALTLRGKYAVSNTLELRKVRELPKPKKPFYIIAHRAGGRNSDRLLRSENSVEMMQFAPTLGANGIEIDIKRTRDDQLIVFHDDTFSPRTVQGSYVFGDVRSFSLHDIERYCRLIYGEKVPTLKEFLRAAIDNSSHELIWLDVKDADASTDIIKEQKEALDYARSKGNAINIVFGIPTEEVLNAYNASSEKDSTPVLCELSPDVARSLKTCTIWAPRWTNGTLGAEVDRMHKDGILVVTWTLDVRDYMNQFLTESTMDGILTNYPSLLAGMYYGLRLR